MTGALAALPRPDVVAADVAVVGSGGAGLMAVRHAAEVDPELRIALVSKGLVGRSGCSIMAQGINAALGPDDAPSIHFEDLVRGGAFLSDQSLAHALATDAPVVARELVDELGCAFEREADGLLALHPFPGQSRRRKLARATVTGLEIVSRLRDDLLRTRPIELADHRVLDILVGDRGVAGVVALDTRRGAPVVITAPVVVLASGGSAAGAYRVATPAREKAADGLAIALRAGLALRDMEFVQFLSVGLAAGPSRLTGILLEEALRFAGAVLRNAHGVPFMAAYDERGDRAPRDVVAAACYAEIVEGRGTPDGGVLLDCRPIGRARLQAGFAELVARAALTGRDLAAEPVPVAPAAHIGIGGVVIDDRCGTAVPGLLVAGEDAGGVHGASWAGGNGIAESTVFGRRAGARAAELARERGPVAATGLNAVDAAAEASLERAWAPLVLATVPDSPRFGRATAGPTSTVDTPFALGDALRDTMWDLVGLRRDAAGLAQAARRIGELRDRAARLRVPGPAAANAAWGEALDLESRLAACEAVVMAATTRTESRGVHRRSDHPAADDRRWLRTIVVSGRPGDLRATTIPIALDRLRPRGPTDLTGPASTGSGGVSPAPGPAGVSPAPGPEILR